MGTVIRRTFAGLRWILVGAVVAAVVVGVSAATAAVATDPGGYTGHTVAFRSPVTTDWSLVANPSVSRQQAIDEAVRAVPGSSAVDAELDTDDGPVVWEVEVRTPDGVESEVRVDANTGKALGVVAHD